MLMLVVSRNPVVTPEEARETGRPILWIQSAVHGGEVAGKDATILLLRDMALTDRHSRWLDRLIILLLPVFNIDGHDHSSPFNRANQNGPASMGFRANAQRLNLNRDYMKADSPEMRCWLRAYTAWLPHLVIDNHTTNGMDYQYDITFSVHRNQPAAEPVARWARKWLQPALARRLAGDGHITGPHVELEDAGELERGIQPEVSPPGYCLSYTAIQNRVAILAESHSLKCYRTQVCAHYDLMRHVLDLLSSPGGAALRTAVHLADRKAWKASGSESRGPVFVEGVPGGRLVPYQFKGLSSTRTRCKITGVFYTEYSDEPIDIPVKSASRVRTTLAIPAPVAYVVPPECTPIIDVLACHGIQMWRLGREFSGEFESWRLVEEHWDPLPFEGRLRMTFRAIRSREERTLSAGSRLVPMAQRAGRVALNLLAPDAPGSLVRWGFLNAIFEQKEYISDHVLAPMVARMWRADSRLRAEFRKRLRSEPSFAADPTRQMQFFYEHSPYFESGKNLYPILRVGDARTFTRLRGLSLRPVGI